MRLAKGSIAAGGGEGDGPGTVDIEDGRTIRARARVREAIGLDFAACLQNNNAALEGLQLQRTVKRNGIGTVQQVETRAAQALASSKCNRAANALTRMLVD